MKKTVLLFGDYFFGETPEKEFRKVKEILSAKGVKFVYFDWLKRSFCLAKEVICTITNSGTERVILSSGVGMIPAILAANILPVPPKKIVIVGPVFGKGSIRYKWHEKLRGRFFGFGSMESEEYWQKQYSYLDLLVQKGVEIVFLLSPMDGRTEYSDEATRKMESFSKKDNVFYFDVGGGHNTIRHKYNLPLIRKHVIGKVS